MLNQVVKAFTVYIIDLLIYTNVKNKWFQNIREQEGNSNIIDLLIYTNVKNKWFQNIREQEVNSNIT